MTVVERRIYPDRPLRAAVNPNTTRRVHVPAEVIDRYGRRLEVAACSDTVLLRPKPTRHRKTPKLCQRCAQDMREHGLLP